MCHNVKCKLAIVIIVLLYCLFWFRIVTIEFVYITDYNPMGICVEIMTLFCLKSFQTYTLFYFLPIYVLNRNFVRCFMKQLKGMA